jgi:alkylation response protein AidB-like acyl-CoA dehydrogenase
MAVVLCETGYACLPGPFFSSVVMGGLTLLEGGSEEQKKGLLPQVASGERIFTLAWTEKSGTYSLDPISTRAELQGNSYVLNGTKLFVPYAHVADTVICVAAPRPYRQRPKGISLFLVDGKSGGFRSRFSTPWPGTSSARWSSIRSAFPGRISWARSTRAGGS